MYEAITCVPYCSCEILCTRFDFCVLNEAVVFTQIPKTPEWVLIMEAHKAATGGKKGKKKGKKKKKK